MARESLETLQLGMVVGQTRGLAYIDDIKSLTIGFLCIPHARICI